MLRILTYVGAVVWIVHVIAWLVSLAATVTDQAPKKDGVTQQTTPDSFEENKRSVVSVIEGRSWDFVHTYSDEITLASTVIIAVFTVVLGTFTIILAGSTKIAGDALPTPPLRPKEL